MLTVAAREDVKLALTSHSPRGLFTRAASADASSSATESRRAVGAIIDKIFDSQCELGDQISLSQRSCDR